MRLIGAAQDTTSRNDAEARVARVMDSMSTAFFFVDTALAVHVRQRRGRARAGAPRDELLGHSSGTSSPRRSGSEFETHYRHAADSGEPVAFDAYYPEPLNAWYEVRAWPSPDGLAVYFIDVTDRRAAEQNAQRAISRAGLHRPGERGPRRHARRCARRCAGSRRSSCPAWPTGASSPSSTTTGTPAPAGASGDALGWHADPDLRELVDVYAMSRLEQMTDHSLVVRAVETSAVQVLNGNALSELATMFEPGAAPLRMLTELDAHSVVVLPLSGQEQSVGHALGGQHLRSRRVLSTRTSSCCARSPPGPASCSTGHGCTASSAPSPRPCSARCCARRRRARTCSLSVAYVPAAEVAQVGGDWYDAFNQPDGSTTAGHR